MITIIANLLSSQYEPGAVFTVLHVKIFMRPYEIETNVFPF